MFWQQVINGLAQGSIYALLAVGFALISGIMKRISFSHGEVFMVGAFAGLVTVKLGQGLIMGLAVAIVSSLVLGLITERIAFRPFVHGSELTPALITIGLSILLQDAVLLAFGGDTKPFPLDVGAFQIQAGSAIISGLDLVIFILPLVLVGLLQFFIHRTRWGLALRATAQHKDASSLMGIKPELVMAITFALASALAGVAGILVGIYYNAFYPRMGVVISLKALSAATLGGIGNVSGAVIGGLTLGLLESLAVAFISTSYRDVIAFLILILVLLIRPAGLLGRVGEERA